MNNYLSREMILYLFNEIGLEESSIELGIKLSIKNQTPLPILLWSYGMLTIEELDKLYSFLFQKIENDSVNFADSDSEFLTMSKFW